MVLKLALHNEPPRALVGMLQKLFWAGGHTQSPRFHPLIPSMGEVGGGGTFPIRGTALKVFLTQPSRDREH